MDQKDDNSDDSMTMVIMSKCHDEGDEDEEEVQLGLLQVNSTSHSRVLGCPLFHLLINGVYWGYNPLILTLDPNFQRDIGVAVNFKAFSNGQSLLGPWMP